MHTNKLEMPSKLIFTLDHVSFVIAKKSISIKYLS